MNKLSNNLAAYFVFIVIEIIEIFCVFLSLYLFFCYI